MFPAAALTGVFAFGGALIVMAGCLYLITEHRRLRAHVLRRFAGVRADRSKSAPARGAPTAAPALRQAGVEAGGARARGDLFSWRGALRARRRATLIATLIPTAGALAIEAFARQDAPWTTIAAAPIYIAGAIYALTRWHRGAIAAEIEANLPDALETIVRSLRIGVPISVAIRSAAESSPGALGREFAGAADQVNFGKETSAALAEMARRCDDQTLRFLAAAVAIQSETGGNLAALVAKLGQLSRARIQLRRKISSITAEARWSGVFLSAFPILAALVLWLANPDYFAPMRGHPATAPILAAVAGLIVVNVIFMRRIIRFD